MKKIILFILVVSTFIKADIMDITVIKEMSKITRNHKINNQKAGLIITNFHSQKNKIVTIDLNQKNLLFQHVKNIHKYKHFKILEINAKNQINDYELVGDKLKLYIPEKEAFLRIKVKATPNDKRFSHN